MTNKKNFLILVLMLSFSSITQAHTVEKNYYIFSGSSNKQLAETIAYYLRTPLRNIQIIRFEDGETNIKLFENVRNKRVFIIQSICKGNNINTNDSVMELYLLSRTLKKYGVKSITAVIPYFGYTRQNRKDFNYAPVSASDIAMLLETASIKNIITIDLHNVQIQGFFQHAVVENIYAATIIAPYFANLRLKNPVIVSLHSNGLLRAEHLQKSLSTHGIKAELALAIRQLSDNGDTEGTTIIGKVKGRDVILIDDICDTGDTVVQTTETLKKAGALKIYAALTHPILSGKAIEKLANVDIEIVTTDTIPIQQKLPKNIKQLSVASCLAEAIKSINDN
jgi:ribose-phosphate pyrophosphokinase